MTIEDTSDQLIAAAYNQSDAETFTDINERALFLYIVLENPEQILQDHNYYERHTESSQEADSQ